MFLNVAEAEADHGSPLDLAGVGRFDEGIPLITNGDAKQARRDRPHVF